MTHPLDRLRDLASQVDDVVGEVLRDETIRRLSDADLVAALTIGGALLRRVEGLLIEAVGSAEEKCALGSRETALAAAFGCRSLNELVQRTTRLSPQSTARLQRAARAVYADTVLATGEVLEAEFPAMRESVLDGHSGLDGVLAVTTALRGMSDRVTHENVLAADTVLAAEARGEGPDAAPPACADLLKLQAQAWAAVLDQDGAEPLEARALRTRGITLGVARDGVVPVRGNLLPEVAAQFQRICDADLNPKLEGSGAGVRFVPAGESVDDGSTPTDDRTRPQKQHDALATALFAAASSGLLPTIGGAAPTLVVSVREADLVAGTGWAHVDGTDIPVSAASARHIACSGAIQRIILADTGRIISIGTEERVFNRHQRRAIALRDGGCVIPGCGVPAGWCEIHHVQEHAHGGPTHTDNGVLLCWFHHRFLDTHGWRIRMNRGVPEVRAPGWFDASLRWRAVTRSRTRLPDLIARRT